MKIINSLHHAFLPRYSNNFKAKLLHTPMLFALTQVLLIVFFSVQFLSSPAVSVLGYAANISPQKVVELTNQKRAETGQGLLIYSDKLSEAAKMKGEDMLTKNYWAHVSPTGTEPWEFFKTVGYSYRYAGENLARDFSDPEAAIEAWMASPSHKENLLSGKYTQIGVAVVEGDLDGKDTTIIVQLFGTPSTAGSSFSIASAKTEKADVLPATPEPSVIKVEKLASEAVPISAEPLAVEAKSFDIMRTTTLIVISLMIMVLVVDIVVVSRRGIKRFGGRTFAHLSFFAMIFVILILLRTGQIL